MSIRFLSDESVDGNVSLADNKKLILGAGSDLQIYHDGTNSYIKDSGTGNLILNATDFVVNNSADTQNMIIAVDGGATTLFCAGVGRIATTSTGVSVTGGISLSGDISASTGDLALLSSSGEYILYGATDAQTNLYHNGIKKFETTSTGVTVTGGWVTDGVSVAQANIEHTDNTKSTFGNGNDLSIYHDGTNSYITENGTGDLFIGSDFLGIQNSAHNEYMAKFFADSSVKLYYDNVQKFQTTSTGIEVSGTASSFAGNSTFAGDITVSGGDITLGGTGRIQGIDTVSAGTDAANKTYVDNAVAGGGSGTVTSSGTIAITMAGTSSQYIDGAGDLTTFPSIPQGDITEVIAGNKLTGGGTSGSVTLGLASNNISQFTNDSGYTTNTGTMSSWIISSDAGAATITNGATMKIAGGTNISTAESSGVVTITNGVTNNNQLTNGAGYTTNTGDITNVSTTAPIIGGGASGSVIIEHAASGALPGIYPNADITVDATGHVTAVASGAPGFISANNAPANFGFQSPEVPDNTGLFAAGWVIINIGGQNYYIPAWTP